MTGRDRIVIIVVVVAVILAAGWLEVVSPERKQANELSAQVTAAQAQLASAEGQVAHARAAQSQYATAYASMVSLGKAVPPSQEVPSLIYQLSRATNQKNVNFDSISSSSAGTSSSGSADSAASAGFSALPFSFTFEGTYFNLEHLFSQLTDFATLSRSGDVNVSGRLLTIQSVSLAPHGSEAGEGGSDKLSGSIAATAYVLPAGQTVTGATGTPATAAATPAASTGAAPSSPTSAAVVKVNP